MTLLAPVRYRLARGMTAATLIVLAACTAGLTDVPDPSTIVDPNAVKTQEGAVSLYRGSLTAFALIFGGAAPTSQPQFVMRGYSYALATGFASDEFSSDESLDGMGEYFMQRSIDPFAGHDIAQPYSDLHTTRLYIDQAIGALRDYAKTTPKSYLGEMFALKGYLYVMFAELYCSGVPFSEAVYGGDVVLGQPQSTEQMLNNAVALFDTAIAVSTDSAPIRSLAYVGKARALVDLGNFADAAEAASETHVPTTFSYELTYSAQTFANFFGVASQGGFAGGPSALFMGSRLGNNGLPYAEAGDAAGAAPDPRVAWIPMSPPFNPLKSFPVPAKYATASAPVVLASGTEARLIEAEAALQNHEINTWANALNALRADAGIPPLTADSTTAAPDTLQTSVMFRERAFWLYGTGHRMGDMRRLMRQYHRAENAVFPVGSVFSNNSSNILFYTTNVNFAPPKSEQANNPYYHGCINRDP